MGFCANFALTELSKVYQSSDRSLAFARNSAAMLSPTMRPFSHVIVVLSASRHSG
jgi:hypothetical protein